MSYCDYDERYRAIEKEVKIKRIKRINDRLRLCPCCGGKAEVKEGFDTDGRCGYVTVYVECSRCGLRTEALITDGYFDEWHTPEEAGALWNRRYSGINDKNGKPICDGNYIRITGKNWADGIPGEYEVCYSDLSFAWWLKKVIDDADYVCSRVLSFSDLNIRHFTDEIELVTKEG